MSLGKGASLMSGLRSRKKSDGSDTSASSEGGPSKPLLVVAYYTIDTPYETEVENLRRSLAELPLVSEIIGVPNLGSWQANTQYKAVFLRDMLAKHGATHRLLYVDADAVVREYPSLLDRISCDVAVHSTPRGPLSGTIYLESTPATRSLLGSWIEENLRHPRRWDQVNLGAVLARKQKELGLRLVELPVEYTFIFDLFRRNHPDAQPVIEHFQASRRFKRRVCT